MRRRLIVLSTILLIVSVATAGDITTSNHSMELGGEDIITLDSKILELDFVGPTMIESAEDGYYVMGYLDGSIKYVKVYHGEAEIIRTYQTDYASDGVYDETTDDEGNRYVACFAHNGTDNDIGTIKFNPQGGIEWVQVFDSGGKDISWSIGVDDEGNVYAAGFTYLGNADGVRIIKYDAQGQMVWMVIYDEEGYDKPESISFDEDGNVQVSCFSDGKGIHTITYDPNGNRI